jgi:hypothetical protein
MKQETVINSEQVNWEHEFGKWLGAFMVLMGAIFFMGTSGITIAGRSPWMLVALLPLYWIIVTAYRCYKEDGRLTRRVFSIAILGVLPIAYFAALALGYSVSGLWPLGIIVVGVSFVLYSGSK